MMPNLKAEHHNSCVEPSSPCKPANHLHCNPAITCRVYPRGFHTLILFVAFHEAIILLLYGRVKHPCKKIFTFCHHPRTYKERVRTRCNPRAIHLRPASSLAHSPLGRAIFDPPPFGLRLQHILSSDASKFVNEEYPSHNSLIQTKTNKPKRK